MEKVNYRDHDIVLTDKGEWSVFETSYDADPQPLWIGRTVGECQAAIDEVLEDM